MEIKNSIIKNNEVQLNQENNDRIHLSLILK
jgi:hypothetical protein